MNYCWTTLHVKDFEESLEFYQNIVGLDVVRRFEVEPNREIAFLGDGETKVELVYEDSQKDINIGEDISLGFEINSVEEMLKFLKDKDIPIDSGPFQPNPNIQFFYIKDPNGLKIQFVENL